MLKALFLILITFLFLNLFVKTAFASTSNFATDYNVEYTIGNNAVTHTKVDLLIKNLTDKYYASSYSIQVRFKNIKNLKVTDDIGKITPKLTKKENGTLIDLDFNKRVSGINKTINLIISFDTDEIAQNHNNVWDVNIPGISNPQEISTFNVIVNYPLFLGPPTYIKPHTDNKILENGVLQFNKNDLGDSGISLGFGNFQVYNFDLTYHIQNRNIFAKDMQIALPPDTGYQKVLLSQISPKPKNVILDKDGNWIAYFNVPPSKKININAKGSIKVFLTPKKEVLTPTLQTEYLKSQKYWEVDNNKIKELAKKLKTPEAIYHYVVKTLHYDFTRIKKDGPRLGAVSSLENPGSALCLEFTDLFISLARASGIPAREVDGYGFTSNSSQRPISDFKDILHAWPEFYDFDKNSWIMVDPTWGNTTEGTDYFSILDLDHIAFVIKGLDSQNPIPAGGYKLSEDKNKKDVSILTGSNFSENSKINAKVIPAGVVTAGLPYGLTINVENNGNSSVSKVEIELSSDLFNPKTQKVFTGTIPPLGNEDLNAQFNSVSALTKQTNRIKISLADKDFYIGILILPFFLSKQIILGGLLLVSICIIIPALAYIYRRLSIPKQRG